MLNIENLTNKSINYKILERISSGLTDKEIDITICDNETIKRYNYEYRGVNRATDVLSFPIISEFESMPLGSIIISIDKVIEKSHQLGHSLEEELALLFIHGLLHLLGFDHEVDNGEMRERERELIEEFNLPKSLIVRTERL
jgi:probable rRNA maturation factor